MSESSSASASSLQSDTLKKLHLGCGTVTPSGWVNSDVRPGAGVDLVADLIKGLPVKDESFDAVVSIHALCELGVWDQVPVLKEIHRVLKPGGVLRLSLPDLDVNIKQYQARNQSHFQLYQWDTVAGNFITQVLWHSTIRCFYTREFVEELLKKAGFSQVNHVSFGTTSTRWPVLATLDNRQQESLFVEAVK
jgi:predicted SAM-dependent methyltransferase